MDWIKINSTADLPYYNEEKDKYQFSPDDYRGDPFSTIYESETAIFTLENAKGQNFIGIGRVIFFKDDKLDQIFDFEADTCGCSFDGVAIAPSDYLGDEYRYISGQICAKPIAWMPYEPFDVLFD